MTIQELVGAMEADGLLLRAEGSELFLEGPSDMRDRWRMKAKENKAALWKFLRQPDRLTELRGFCPALWSTVRVKGVGIGLIWGVHARGVVVHVMETNVLLTLAPEDVELISCESQR